MSGEPSGDRRAAALAELARALTQALAIAEWEPAASQRPHVVALSRPAPSKVCVTAVLVDPPHIPGTKTKGLRLDVGVGYQPATDLMPLLFLNPPLALLANPLGPDASRRDVGTVDASTDITAVVDTVVAFLDAAAHNIASRFPTHEAIEAVLREELDALPTNDDGEPFVQGGTRDPRPLMRRDHLVSHLAVLLAVTQRHDQALDLVVGFPAHHDQRGPTDSDRRFLRQLDRWIDAGSPTPPPAATTIAQLPSRIRPTTPTPSFADARTQAQLGKDALADVRRAAPNTGRDERRSLLVNARRQRGLDVIPSGIEVQLDLLEQEPIGRVQGLRTLLGALTSVASGIKTVLAPGNTPEQLRRPPEAAYPLGELNGSWVQVELAERAEAVLGPTIPDAPQHPGGLTTIDAWYPQPAHGDPTPGRLTIHVGQSPIGTIPVRDNHTYSRVALAAELYDESPYMPARLGRFAGQLLLEVTVPF